MGAVSAPLLERDIERAFELVVPDWQIERLDTRWGTEECARYLKGANQVVGVHTHALDDEGHALPYGGTRESWTFTVDARAKGIEVAVLHHAAYDGPEWSIEGLDEWLSARRAGKTVLRSGRISWNRFANMATHAACELKYAGGEGTPMDSAPAGGWGRRPPESFERGEQLTL